MAAGTQDIIIEVGSSFRMSLTWDDEHGNPIDLTGKTAHMQIRPKAGTGGTPLLDATNVANPTTGTVLALGGVLGTINIFLSSADTVSITGKKAEWDLYVITSPTDAVRVLEGKVTLSPSTTVN
jgi:hypothetical protein